MAKISLDLLNKPSFYSSLSETRRKTWFWQFRAFGQPANHAKQGVQLVQVAHLVQWVQLVQLVQFFTRARHCSNPTGVDVCWAAHALSSSANWINWIHWINWSNWSTLDTLFHNVIIWVHSSVVRAADCRSAGPWFKSGCALCASLGTRRSRESLWPGMTMRFLRKAAKLVATLRAWCAGH